MARRVFVLSTTAALLGACVGGGSDDGPAGGRGRFSDYWRRTSAEVSVTDPARPLDPQYVTVPSTGKVPVPGDDREVDLVQQIQDDTLFTYALFDGDSAYYRVAQPLTKVDDSYGLMAVDGMHTFSLEDGHLTDVGTLQIGSLLVITEATYTRLAGDFPPAGWPAVAVDAPLLAQP